MMIGTLAITQVFGIRCHTSVSRGFLSKDAVIESVGGWRVHVRLLDAGDAAAMQSFYSWRLMFLTVFGKATRRLSITHDHAH